MVWLEVSEKYCLHFNLIDFIFSSLSISTADIANFLPFLRFVGILQFIKWYALSDCFCEVFRIVNRKLSYICTDDLCESHPRWFIWVTCHKEHNPLNRQVFTRNSTYSNLVIMDEDECRQCVDKICRTHPRSYLSVFYWE